jgi:hypothetical protein
MNTLSFAEFESWADRQPKLIRENAIFDEAEAFENEAVRFYKGDLMVDELTVSPVTVIDGNVSTQKIVCGYETGLLVVTGNLTCEHIGRMWINTVIGGNLNAKSICANTMNDCALIVGGNLACDFFAEYGCYVEVHGKIMCPKALSLMNEVTARGGIEGELISDLRGKDVAKVLDSAVLTNDGYFDEEKFADCVRNGKSPFKN